MISRKFSAAADAGDQRPAWYDAGWVPMVARNVTALVIALLVLFLGVRPLAKALLKKRDEPRRARRWRSGGADGGRQRRPPVELDMLERAAAAMTTGSGWSAASRATIRRAPRLRCAT